MTAEPERRYWADKARWFAALGVLSAAVVEAFVCCDSAAGLTLYRIELTNSSVIFAESRPTPNGATLSFLSSPQGTLVALRRSEVARIIQMESLDKAPLDLGGTSLKRAVLGVPPVTSLVLRRSGGGESTSGPPKETSSPSGSARSRGYGAGDYTPGSRVAFPVSRDDLLPGNYTPYPAGRGGQTGPPPMLREGIGVPKAGTLREPPEVILLQDAPTAANMQIPAPELIYDEKPHIDETVKARSAKAELSLVRSPLSPQVAALALPLQANGPQNLDPEVRLYLTSIGGGHGTPASGCGGQYKIARRGTPSVRARHEFRATGAYCVD